MKHIWQKLTAFKFTWAIALFNAAKAEWLKLTLLEQKLSVQASGVMAIITQNMSATPDFIWSMISYSFPAINKDVVTDYLSKAANILKVIDNITSLSFDNLVKAFQSWVLPAIGDKWATLLQSAVNVIYTLIAPQNTVIDKVINLFSWIYSTFVKGKIVIA